jgi:hypothetical protein
MEQFMADERQRKDSRARDDWLGATSSAEAAAGDADGPRRPQA